MVSPVLLALAVAVPAPPRIAEARRPAVDVAAMHEAMEPGAGTFASAAAYAHFLRARLAHLAGDERRAVDELRLALATDEKDPYLAVALGEAYARLGDWAHAEARARGVLERSPDDFGAQLLLARVLYETHQFPRARAVLRRALALRPREPDPYLLLAEMSLEAGQLDEAMRTVGELADVASEPVGLKRLGQALMEKGDGARAETLLARAARIDPGDVETWVSLAGAQESLSLPASAEESLAHALEVDPDNRDVLLDAGKQALHAGAPGRARAYLDRAVALSDDPDLTLRVAFTWLGGQRPAEASGVLDAARRSGRADARVSFYAGLLHERAGRWNEAVRAYTEVPPGAQVYPDARLRRASALAHAGRAAEAVALLRAALIASPDDLALYPAYAEAVEASGRPAEAERFLRDALAARGSPELTEALAVLLERQGRAPEAIALLTRAVDQTPRQESLLFGLAAAYERSGDHARSIARMREVLAINPDNAAALNFIGYTLADQGLDLDEAERMLRRALELRPDTGAFLDSLGWVYFRRHDLARAVPTLERAAALEPDEPVIAEHLGDAYLGQDRKREAVGAYRRALEAARTSTDPESVALRPRVEHKLKGLSSDVADR
ncbi:MAG TPA: tetratricopeptide repeat protein [Myxococcaceae bacterium]|nr:tetratricopeptide repeat protein [Myxococcaceae bacterium]